MKQIIIKIVVLGLCRKPTPIISKVLKVVSFQEIIYFLLNKVIPSPTFINEKSSLPSNQEAERE